VTIIIIRNSRWADEPYKTFHGSCTSSFSYTQKSRYNGSALERIDENNRMYMDFLLECDIENGAVIFTVSDMHDNKPGENEESYTVVYEERISESGSYIYKASDFKNGSYLFMVVAENDEVTASGKLAVRYYYSNWEMLMRRLGLMRD